MPKREDEVCDNTELIAIMRCLERIKLSWSFKIHVTPCICMVVGLINLLSQKQILELTPANAMKTLTYLCAYRQKYLERAAMEWKAGKSIVPRTVPQDDIEWVLKLWVWRLGRERGGAQLPPPPQFANNHQPTMSKFSYSGINKKKVIKNTTWKSLFQNCQLF